MKVRRSSIAIVSIALLLVPITTKAERTTIYTIDSLDGIALFGISVQTKAPYVKSIFANVGLEYFGFAASMIMNCNFGIFTGSRDALDNLLALRSGIIIEIVPGRYYLPIEFELPILEGSYGILAGFHERSIKIADDYKFANIGYRFDKLNDFDDGYFSGEIGGGVFVDVINAKNASGYWSISYY